MTTLIGGYAPFPCAEAHRRAASLKQQKQYPHQIGGTSYLHKIQTAPDTPTHVQSQCIEKPTLRRSRTTDYLKSIRCSTVSTSMRIFELLKKGVSQLFGMRFSESIAQSDLHSTALNASTYNPGEIRKSQSQNSVQTPINTVFTLTPVEYKQMQSRIVYEANKVFLDGFLKRQPIELNSDIVRQKVVQRLKGHPLFGQLKQNYLSVETALILRKLKPDFTLSRDGDYFKAHKRHKLHHPMHRLDSSVVRSSNGQLYELINSPTAAQRDLLQKLQLQVEEGSFKLGEGSFGKVRLARNMHTGDIVAVKKFISRIDAENEIKEHKRIGQGKGLSTMLDYAHVNIVGQKRGQPTRKSYVFLPLSNQGNGKNAAEKIASLLLENPQLAEQKLKNIDFNYAEHIATLHKKGFAHRDIKPENYLHSTNGEILLTDFGFATPINGKQPNPYADAGTPRYLPPEYLTSRYDPIKHDAFSLGLTMLETKLGNLPDDLAQAHLTINGRSFSLTADERGLCLGTNLQHPDLNKMKYETRDEVIAGLLSYDPQTRLTPTQMLNTPYMKSLAQENGSIHISQKPFVSPTAQPYQFMRSVVVPNFSYGAFSTQNTESPALMRVGLGQVNPVLQPPNLPIYAFHETHLGQTQSNLNQEQGITDFYFF